MMMKMFSMTVEVSELKLIKSRKSSTTLRIASKIIICSSITLTRTSRIKRLIMAQITMAPPHTRRKTQRALNSVDHIRARLRNRKVDKTIGRETSSQQPPYPLSKIAVRTGEAVKLTSLAKKLEPIIKLKLQCNNSK